MNKEKYNQDWSYRDWINQSTPLLLGLVLGLFAHNSHAGLSQSPLYLTISADPNVLINLSVEGPMGGAAYSDQPGNPTGCNGRVDNALGDNSADNIGSCYSPTTEYVGYFDPKKCYDYSAGQFEPSGAATIHVCSGKWSGNFLNWASMTAIDEFIWGMTGGYRITDTIASTVVRRARSHDSWFPVKVINSSINVAPSTVTPYGDATLFIVNSDPPSNLGGGRVGSFSMRIGTDYANATGNNPDKGSFDIKVKLCENSANMETNCVPYTPASGPTYYKPEGQLQKYASSKRFALSSYTADNDFNRHGGVLRSKMKYVGPLQPDGSGGLTNNPNKEFGDDGLLVNNPDGATDNLNSGIINYINQFSTNGYKSYDPVSELFYESVRYFKNLGPTTENYNSINRTSGDARNGGFWFYKEGEWDDPIQHSCQKNSIIAINDAYPWLDKHLPGTAFTSQTINNATPPGGTYDLNAPAGGGLTNDWGQPSNADGDIDVKSLTDQVGAMENGRWYQSNIYRFDLNNFMVTGGDGNHTALCSRKNIAGAGLGSVMGTCPESALNDWAARDNTYYIAGLAWYANTQDLRSDLADKQTISTYMIDTQEYHFLPNIGPTNPLWLAGKYGGFVDTVDINNPSNGANNPNVDKSNSASNTEWDSDGNGEPDNYLLASDPGKLVSALSKAFSSIDSKQSSASAVAANSSQLNTGTQVYQAKFDSTDWSGSLKAFNVNPSDGTLTDAWSATLPEHTNRNIYTYNPLAAAGSRGVIFDWNNLTPTQQTDLNTLAGSNDGKGSLRVSWLRGDDTNEIKNTNGIFRNRNISRLGDIVNSDPTYVGSEDYGYGALSSLGTSYSTFLAGKSSRQPMIYVGANDGMLHGFNATASSGGLEVFGYVPNALFPELSKLTSLGYSHQYYVDGASAAGDVYDGSSWRSVLVGSTGAGGRAVFGLDVTNPTFAAGSALWEFTHTDDVDLGYTLTQPSVVRMEDGSWAALVANGYNSDNGHAVLFVINALTGAVLQKIDTGVGSTTNKNGLSSPIGVDTDNNYGIDTIYAGDLYGNLWRFDVSGSAGSWTTPAAPFFVACTTTGTTCPAANRQPITGKPNVGPAGQAGTNPAYKSLMVYFGTGKYFETGDNLIGSNPQVQTFYGLWDKTNVLLSTPTADRVVDYITDRANLQEQSIDFEGLATSTCATGTGSCSTTKPVRIVSKNPVCYAATSTGCSTTSSLKNGWALNLVKPGNVAEGERVVSYPLMRRGFVVFATAIPDPNPCKTGGRSWLMEVDAIGGGAFGGAPFDTNGDGAVNSNDNVTVTIAGNSVTGPASGVDSEIGMTKSPAVVESSSGVDYKYLSGTASGAMGMITDIGLNSAVRRSWRQLK